MNNSTLEQETKRLELALRKNVAGKPQILQYNPRSGQIEISQIREGQGPDTQFGLMNREAMTQWFGGADDEAACVAEPIDAEVVEDDQHATYYEYDSRNGDFVDPVSHRTAASNGGGNIIVGQFGTIMGDSFTSTFGCDVTVASVSESSLDLGGGDAALGFAYTLENEGVARIVRGSEDPLAKGVKDNAVFARKGESSALSADDARYVVLLGGKEEVSVIEKTPNGDRMVPSVEIIPDRTGLYSLGSGLIESSSLKDACVLLLGCGSMGCDIALHMAMAGAGKIMLVDPDRIEASNLSRLREAVIADVGRRKVDMLEERILGKNPSCKVVKVGEDITKDADRMGALLADADVAVVSTDNRASRILFSQALHSAGKPCVFARCSTRAESGDCFIARPGQACYECLYKAIGVTAEEVDDFSSAKKAGRLAAYCTPKDMGDFAVLPGISVDISAITAFASRLALWELSKAIGNDQFDLFSKEFAAFNYFLYVNRREKHFKNDAWAPFDKSAEKPCPQRWYGATVPRLEDCPCCGGHDEMLDSGEEDAALFDSMSQKMVNYYANENKT